MRSTPGFHHCAKWEFQSLDCPVGPLRVLKDDPIPVGVLKGSAKNPPIWVEGLDFMKTGFHQPRTTVGPFILFRKIKNNKILGGRTGSDRVVMEMGESEVIIAPFIA